MVTYVTTFLLANKLAIIIVLLAAILTTVGVIARNSVHQAAVIEEALKPLPQTPPMTNQQIEETAQKPMRPSMIP